MTMVAKYLLQAMLLNLNPTNVKHLVKLFFPLLERLTKESKTDLDDQLFKLFKDFINQTEADPDAK